MDELLAGVARFQAEVFPKERQRFALLANSQAPRALFITCADSRVQPNLITQTEPGELFICRDIGNIVPPYGAVYGGVSATIEYAVSVLDIGHIVVCGHSDCGAMRALVHREKLAGLPSVEAWLQQAEAARRTVAATHPEAEGEELLDLLIEQNVVTQLANLRTHPAVAARAGHEPPRGARLALPHRDGRRAGLRRDPRPVRRPQAPRQARPLRSRASSVRGR